MPRGKKRNPTGRTKRQRIPVSDHTNDQAAILAASCGLLNPRTGEGNRSELVEKAVVVLSELHSHYLPKQNELILWLLQITQIEAIPPLLRDDAALWAEYLKSWSIECSSIQGTRR